MKKIVVIRHAATAHNKEKLVIGHLNPPIDDSSIQEIRAIGKFLKEEEFDIIYSSDLLRCRETTQRVASILVSKPRIAYSKSLREIDYGILSGKRKDDVKRKFPLYHKDVDYINPGGESFSQLYSRVVKFINRIYPRYDNMLLVTHAGCIRALYSYFRGEDFQKNLNMRISHTFIMEYTLNKNDVPKLVIRSV